MASLSSREVLLEKTVATLLPQVDVLCVYLNGYRTIPDCLSYPKVAHAVLSSEHGWRTGEAKLLFWDRAEWKAPPYWDDDDIALIVDDDIIYPTDYVARHVAAIERRPHAISCVHGSVMFRTFTSYSRDRMVARCHEGLAEDARVHIPGAGTMAFRRGAFEVSLRRDMLWSHCVDVMTAIAAKRQGVESWALARGKGWLFPMPLPRGTGVYKMRASIGNDLRETQHLQAERGWPELPTDIIGFTPRIRTMPPRIVLPVSSDVGPPRRTRPFRKRIVFKSPP